MSDMLTTHSYHKDVDILCYSDEEKERAESEVKTLADLSGQPGHPGIVCYYASWTESPPSVWLKQFDSQISHIASCTDSETTNQPEREKDWLHPSTLLYVNMEFCPQTLKSWLSTNTVRDQKQVQDLFHQMVEAVDYVHEHELTHGHIKVYSNYSQFVVLLEVSLSLL